MTLPKSAFAYRDCNELMSKALEDEEGIRVKVDDLDAAYHLRARCHMARKINRDDNHIQYPIDHPLHHRSEWDQLRLLIRKVAGQFYLYFERVTGANLEGIENLSEIEDEVFETIEKETPQTRPTLQVVAGSGFIRRV